MTTFFDIDFNFGFGSTAPRLVDNKTSQVSELLPRDMFMMALITTVNITKVWHKKTISLLGKCFPQTTDLSVDSVDE